MGEGLAKRIKCKWNSFVSGPDGVRGDLFNTQSGEGEVLVGQVVLRVLDEVSTNTTQEVDGVRAACVGALKVGRVLGVRADAVRGDAVEDLCEKADEKQKCLFSVWGSLRLHR